MPETPDHLTSLQHAAQYGGAFDTAALRWLLESHALLLAAAKGLVHPQTGDADEITTAMQQGIAAIDFAEPKP